MTSILLLVTATMAWPWSNRWGPGSDADRKAGIAGSTGEPYQGFHIATRDPKKSWDAQITLADGSTKQNQYIVKDAEAGAAAIEVDPANGYFGEGSHPTGKRNYVFNTTTNLWDLPAGEPNAGYPSTPVKETYVSIMQDAGRDIKGTNGSADGLVLTQNGKSSDGYSTLASTKDYMLLVFGAKWCSACEDFKPRFAKFYEKQIANQENGKKFDAVYFSNEHDEAQFKEDVAKMPCKVAPFDQNLADRLERTLGKNEIPCVIVVNKAGELVTADGVRAIKGLSNDGKYPLPSGAEFFTDEPILPNGGDCAVDAAAQRKELKARAEKLVNAMNHDELVKQAQKVAQEGETIPQDEGALKQFVKERMEKSIDDATDAIVQELYAAEQELASNPENYKFQVNDYVRVKKAFMSDPANSGAFTSLIPAEDKEGKRNVGQVLQVGSKGGSGAAGVEGSIKVRFNDNKFMQRWILPEHFENIEKIPESEKDL